MSPIGPGLPEDHTRMCLNIGFERQKSWLGGGQDIFVYRKQRMLRPTRYTSKDYPTLPHLWDVANLGGVLNPCFNGMKMCLGFGVQILPKSHFYSPWVMTLVGYSRLYLIW